MKGQEFEKEEILDEEIIEGETEEIPFNDKRRFNEEGERINIEVNEQPQSPEKAETKPTKSPDVIRLENVLREMANRCEAAENKLQEVQKRFEQERSKLENETAEMRTRMKRSLEQRAEQGRFNFLTALLPVLDNLNLAIEASEKDASFEHLLGGVKGTARSFVLALMNVGVKPIESVGETFDPELHEAVDMVETEAENDGKIMAEYSRGYTFKERLLRPARVQVGMAANTAKSGE